MTQSIRRKTLLNSNEEMRLPNLLDRDVCAGGDCEHLVEELARHPAAVVLLVLQEVAELQSLPLRGAVHQTLAEEADEVLSRAAPYRIVPGTDPSQEAHLAPREGLLEQLELWCSL